MLQQHILLVIFLFFIMAFLYLISQKIKIPYPIFLVIGGLLISFFPGVPEVKVEPEVVFLIFLPPLLFESAWYISWKSFWGNRKPIATMGFFLVLLTSFAIAVFSINIIPDFTFALGFLLGGIISPPDAVAATSVLKNMNLPKRATVLLEGESLVNDAASLTVFRFALITLITGQFVWQMAITQFLILAVMGVVFGLFVAHLIYFILKHIAKASSITTPIMLIAPYLMYLGAEHFHWSGVLSVVSGGLFLSFKSNDYLNYKSRMQTKEVLETVGFLLNGFVFILIGLELPVIIEGLGHYSKEEAIKYAVLITLIIIIIRIGFLWLYFYGIPRIFPKRSKNFKPDNWKLSLVLGWAGMRGVVSLAAALSIPIFISNGVLFPHRNLILFITFIVILITLVFQGLTLPLIIKWLKFNTVEDDEKDDSIDEIRLILYQLSVEYLDNNYEKEMNEHPKVYQLKEQLLNNIHAVEEADEQESKKELDRERILVNQILLELVKIRRFNLIRLSKQHQYDYKLIKRLERNLDLEEARLNN